MLNLKQQNCYFGQCLNPINSVSTEQWHVGVTISKGRQQNFVLNSDLKWFLRVLFQTSPSTELGTHGRKETWRGDEMKKPRTFRKASALATV